MTADALERLVKLAKQAAEDQHDLEMDTEDLTPTVVHGHSEPFDRCEHPDCALVRAGGVEQVEELTDGKTHSELPASVSKVRPILRPDHELRSPLQTEQETSGQGAQSIQGLAAGGVERTPDADEPPKSVQWSEHLCRLIGSAMDVQEQTTELIADYLEFRGHTDIAADVRAQKFCDDEAEKRAEARGAVEPTARSR